MSERDLNMAEIAREFLENSLDNDYINRNNLEAPETARETESIVTNSSSYVLARNDSQLSGDVDRWLRDSPTEIPDMHTARIPNLQRSAPTSTTDSMLSTSFWYLAALVLPLFSANTYPQWRCSPSAALNTAGLLITQMGHACSRIRCHIRRLTENTVARDLFATAMDMILVVYAVGFLILSMYQASLIG